MAKNEVTVQSEAFDLVTLTGEMAAAVAEEMDGLGTIPFDRVKIPSGGGLAFEIPGEDEDNPETTSEILGVIVLHHPVNAYWANKYAGGNEQPDCSSYDGKQGVDRATGAVKNCANCPYNQFGSDTSGSGGKACKNVHRVYILRAGNPVPLIISLPPTSLKGMRDYIGKRVLLKGLRCYDVITKITLKKEQNANGIKYSRAVFTMAGKLTPEQAKAAKAMAESIKLIDKNIDIDDSDYTAAPVRQAATPSPIGDGFMNIPDSVEDEGLPFN